MQECERAKINLSNAYSATVKLTTFHGDKDLEVNIDREKFEELAAPVFEKLKEPLDKAMNSAGLDSEEITEVLLVGGSSRIPWVRRWLETYFQKPPNDMLNADEGVAFGATVMAGLCCGEDIIVEPLPPSHVEQPAVEQPAAEQPATEQPAADNTEDVKTDEAPIV